MDFHGTLVWATDPAHSCFIQCLLKLNTVLSFLGEGLILPCCSCVVVQSVSHVWLSAIPWTGAHWVPVSSTISQSLLTLLSILSVMPSNHLILCHPLLLPPSIFPSIRVFSNESALRIQWPKYWSFSFSFSPSSEFSGLISFRIDWLVWFPCSPRDSQILSSTTVLKHQFFSDQPSLWSNFHILTWLLEKP